MPDSKIGPADSLAGFYIVTERLERLVKNGVITEADLSYTPVVFGGRNIPKIIWTIERLLKEGHLAGVEDSISDFCYLAGMGMPLHAERG